jgi:hypothetical protein
VFVSTHASRDNTTLHSDKQTFHWDLTQKEETTKKQMEIDQLDQTY